MPQGAYANRAASPAAYVGGAVTTPTRAANKTSTFGGASSSSSGGGGGTPWREVHSPSGLRYFYHEATRETTWSPPTRYIPYGAETLASARSPSLAAAKVRRAIFPSRLHSLSPSLSRASSH